ncbi:MAG: zinc-ribbon domain-containing protein [Rickettsiaceae bacterium H1]|nr:zinc-ribbon domain-containing protein [Rickettsiaceae bacterium H1]
MIIVCDKCGTGYQVENSDLGEKRRKVKCSKCNYTWIESPFFTDEDLTDKKVVNNGQLLKLCSVLLTISVVLSLFMVPRSNIYPVLRPIYSIFGIYDAADMEFENVKFDYTEKGILITSTITNYSDEDKILPDIRITFYDGDNNILRTAVLTNSGIRIKEGEKKTLNKQMNNVSAETKYVTLDLGNKLEMWFR